MNINTIKIRINFKNVFTPVIVFFLLLAIVELTALFFIDYSLFQIIGRFSIDNPVRLEKYGFEGNTANVGLPNLIDFTVKKKYIVVLGESTPQGFPYYSNQSWVKIAETLLNENSNPSDVYQVINLSISATTSYYVRDLIKFVFDINPSFVVIYSGHNEFLGQPNFTRTRQHQMNNFLLDFVDDLGISRIAKKLLLFIEKKSNNPESTMMESVFNKFDPGIFMIEDEIVKAYIDNISYAVNTCIENSVPVILFEPVSNILDHPPFRFNGDIEVDFSNKKRYELLSEHKHEFIMKLKNIRDHDLIPFRARSTLINALKNFSRQIQSQSKLFKYVNTEEELENLVGLSAYGSEIFIDHVHFNRLGQILMGYILAKTIQSDIPKLSLNENLLKTFRLKLNLHPVTELMALNNIISILRAEPFKSMRFQGEYKLQRWINEEISLIPTEIFCKLEQVSLDSWIDFYSLTLLEKQNYDELISFNKSLLQIAPNFSTVHLNQAYLLRVNNAENSKEEIFNHYYMAYLFERSLRTKSLMYEYFLKINQLDKFYQIINELGEPTIE